MRPFSLFNLMPLKTALPAIALALVCSAGWAQGGKAVTQDTTLTTKDNHEIKVTYFKSTAGEQAPVVILLPGKTGNRLVWKSFAEQLQKVDFAVVTVDLRGLGEEATGKKLELKRGDYVAMVQLDLEAVKKFLFDEHQAKQLNMNRLGIVATDITAPVAIAYAEYDWEKVPYDDAPTLAQRTPRGQDVQALALLSPEGNVPGLGTNKTLAAIRTLKLPVLMCVGTKAPGNLADAKKMHDILAPKKDGYEHIYLEQYDSKLTGTDLLGKGLKTEGHLFTFLVKHVKERTTPWRDRKSRAE